MAKAAQTISQGLLDQNIDTDKRPGIKANLLANGASTALPGFLRKESKTFTNGLRAKSVLTGGVAGAALLSPITLAQERAEQNYMDDKKFHPGHFAAIAAPAAASTYLGTGLASNFSNALENHKTLGAKGIAKQMFNPKKIYHSANSDFKNIARSFRTGNIKGGLIAALMTGAGAISPAIYASKLKNKPLEKKASSLRKSVRKIKGKVIPLAGAAVAAEIAYRKLKENEAQGLPNGSMSPTLGFYNGR